MANAMPNGRTTKIKAAMEQVGKLIDQLKLEKAHLFSFNCALKDHDEMSSESLKRYRLFPDGGTILWDNIYKVIEGIGTNDSVETDNNVGTNNVNQTSNSSDVKNFLFCIADGTDDGSRHSSREVVEFAKAHNVILKIIYVPGEGDSFDITPDLEDVVIQVDDISDICDISVNTVEQITAADEDRRLNKFSISASVLPLNKDANSHVKSVQNAVILAIPYIEELTGLRYYPVTTYLVDACTIDDFLPSKKNKRESPAKLRDSITEITRFIRAVAITMHTDKFYIPDTEYTSMYILRKPYVKNDIYDRYSEESLQFYSPGVSPEDAFHFRVAAECTWGLTDAVTMIEMGPIELLQFLEHCYCYPGAADKEEYLQKCFDNLNQASMILDRIRVTYKPLREAGGCLSLNDDYLSDEGRDYGDHPDFNLWHGLSPKDRKKLEKCIDPEGLWKKDIDSIAVGFAIAVKLVIELVKEYCKVSVNNPLEPIIREIDCYGVYYHRDLDVYPKMSKHLKKAGFPEWFYPHNTGFVMLSPSKISERLDSIESLKEQETLLEKVILATTIHEHVHAITYEGISSTASFPEYKEQTIAHKNRYKIISESIATWAELNYFRDDPQIFNLILEFASSDTSLKSWPYGGALAIEAAYIKSNQDRMFFTMLLEAFRSDHDVAWEIFEMMRKL
jgi:hypothetical protein